ncbi:MAG TPA: hypothetical protein VKA21_14905 [Candidatus Binatia bacterium]|nr:hypothetical protein [Candidatus Binatia bacterium]
MRTLLGIVVIAIAAAPAAAHFVPIPPSLCAPTITLSVVPAGATGNAETPGVLRIRYDAAGGIADFCAADAADPTNRCTTPGATPFTVGDASGTITLPRFTAAMFASGDLDSPDVPIVVATTQNVSVPVTLTTGLAASSAVVVEGSPIDAGGNLALVGVLDASALSASLAGQTAVVRLSCQATPPPDLDQFGELFPTTIGGTITPRRASIRARIEGNATQPLDVAGQPATVRISAGETSVASAHFPSGLAPRGRRFSATTADGLGVVTVRPRRGGRWAVAVRFTDPAMPAVTGRRTPIDLTFDVGGRLVRAERLFAGSARRLHAR